jgi:TolB-like protein/Tfp pilus assembly protein PilF
VLPFEDLSPEKDQAYFCDGMAEEIILKLSSIKDLKVIARTSVMKYKFQPADVKQIGEELGVSTILEGSVRKEKDRLKITAKLINVEDGFYLWNNSYDNRLEEVFGVQEDVSKAIAEALKVRFKPGKFEASKSGQPASMEAYEYYLKAMYFTKNYIISRNEREFKNAIRMAESALEIDSNYALAYAVLAWTLENHYAATRNEADLHLVNKYCEKSYSLNPDLAQAQICMGWVYLKRGKYDNAFRLYKKALDINPNNFAINQVVGLSYEKIGLYYQAIDYYSKAVELDPFYLYSIWNLADCYIWVGDLDNAYYYYNKCFELSSQTPWFLYNTYIDLLIRMNKHSEAKAIINKIEESDQTMEKYGRARALFYASINDRTKLQQISTEPSLDILLLTGKDQQAIELLKKQIGEGREFHYLKLKYNPYLYKLEANPLFIDFMNEQKSAYEDHLANYINLDPYD